jgi:hypothetical protein
MIRVLLLIVPVDGARQRRIVNEREGSLGCARDDGAFFTEPRNSRDLDHQRTSYAIIAILAAIW